MMSRRQPNIVFLLYLLIIIGAVLFFGSKKAFAADDHLVINEVFTGTETLGYSDQFIELFNPTDSPILLDRSTISRTSGSIVDLSQFIQIESKQYLVLYKSTNTAKSPNNVFGFRLNYASDETVYLKYEVTAVVDSINFNLNEFRGCSISRFPNGIDNGLTSDFQVSIPTPGEFNVLKEQVIIEKPVDETTTIDEARNLENGQTVTVTGTVTTLPGVLSSQYFYIQDETGGIQIYCYYKIFPTLLIGDLISVTGELSETNNARRLKISGLHDIIIQPHTQVVAPEEMSISDIGEDNEGTYVKTVGIVTQTSGDTFYISDGTKEIKVVINKATDIDKPKMKKGDQVEVTGIVSQYKNEYRILPIDQDDVKIVSSEGELPRAGINEHLYLFISLFSTVLWNIYLGAKKKLIISQIK